MTFDALAMHAVREEIEREAVGGHVDAAFLVDDRRLALEIFAGQRTFLMICADPADSRVYLTRDRVRSRTSAVSPFLLLIRKYVRGSRILAIEQPRFERIYCIRFRSHLDGGASREVALYVEAMGRRSNVTLVDEDGTVMDALFRAPPSANPSRPVLPHLRYDLPASQDKHDPHAPDLAPALAGAAATARGDAANLLVAQVDGLSPLAAREALARSGHDARAAASSIADWEAVVAGVRSLTELVETGAWEPTIAWVDGSPAAFAPYRLTHIPTADVRKYATMSEVVQEAGGPTVRAAPLERLKRPLLEMLEGRAESARRKRSSLERSLAMADRAEELRAAGEAILANLHRMEPGAPSLDWEGTRIDLYPSLSAKENAQAYFRQYADAKSARATVPPLLDEVSLDLEYLGEMAVHVELAGTEAELSGLRRELGARGIEGTPRGKQQGKGKRKQQSPSTGMFRRISVDGGEILLGTSALGNDHVTFRLANPEDLWLHARGVPGAHVILKAGRAEPAPAVIRSAAMLAAQHCAARGDGRVEVDYTLRKYVRRIPGAAPGRVTYRQESTLAVDPTGVDSQTV